MTNTEQQYLSDFSDNIYVEYLKDKYGIKSSCKQTPERTLILELRKEKIILKDKE